MSGPPGTSQPYSPADAVPAELVPPQQRSIATACLIGCLGVMLILMLLVVGGIWLIYASKDKIKTFVSDTARETIVSGIQESELDEEEKQAVIDQVDRVVDLYKSGKITNEQLGRIMEELAQSPLMGSLVVVSIDSQYIHPSGLSDEEKQQARRTMQRVYRGVLEEKIQQEELEDALEYVMDRREDNSMNWKASVDDDQLREFVTLLKERADAAEIPDEPFEVRISEQFQRAVDRALTEN
jgi:hypothetical protein